MKNIHKVYLFILIFLFSSSPVSAIEIQCINNETNDLAFHVNNQIDNRIKLSDSSTGLNIYSVRSTEAGSNWTRNSNSWTQKLSPLDFTGVSGSNNDLAHHANNPYWGGATLITPRHFVTANHFRFENGSTVNFYDKEGRVVSRKMTNSYTVPNTDITVGLLESDVDNSITYYPVMKISTLESMLSRPDGYFYNDLPIVVFNQNAQAIIRSLIKKDTPKSFNHANYGDSIRSSFTKDLIEGDSGQPGFIIINDKPILLFANFLTNTSPSLGDYINEINSGIQSLGNSNGYNITEYTNNNFKTYSSFCTGPVLPSPDQFKVTTNTACLSPTDKLKVDITWSKPLNYSMQSSGYQYRLYKNNQSPDFLSMNTYNYTDINVQPNTEYTYILKLYYGTYSSGEVKFQIKTPSLCSSSVIVNNPPVVVSNPVPVTTPLSNYEPLPAKNNDADKDGIIDGLDMCPNTSIDQKSFVNTKGCIKPKITKFSFSKDLSNIDLREVDNLEISNSYGRVLFTSPVSLTRSNQQLDIDTNLYIGNNIVSLNSVNLPELNRGAIITFNNLSYRNPVIYKDDSICTTCEVVSYTNNTFRFKVLGFSNYSVVDMPLIPDKPVIIDNPIQDPTQPVTITQPAVQPVIITQSVVNQSVVQQVQTPPTQQTKPLSQQGIPKLQSNPNIEVPVDNNQVPDADIFNTGYFPEDIY